MIFSIIKTFIIYFLTIISSLLFIELADRKSRKKNKGPFVVLSIIAIIIPCLIAGMRAESVGVDVLTYSVPLFEMAHKTSFEQFAVAANVEIGFAALVYGTTQIFDSIMAVHFIIALFQILPVYGVAFLYRHKFPMRAPMLVYLCIFYLMGFNIMRACIACGFVLLGFGFLTNNKKIMAILSCVIALMFHKSAAIGIMVIAASLFILKIKNRYYRRFILLLCFGAVVIGFRYWEPIANSLIRFRLLPEAYGTRYIAAFNGTNRAGREYMFGVTRTVYAELGYKILFFMIPTLIFILQKGKRDNLSVAFQYVCGLSVFIYLYFVLHFRSSYIYRVTTYGEYFFTLLIPASCSFKTSQRYIKTRWQNLLLAVLLVSYVAITYCCFNAHGVRPYLFQ